MTQRDNNKSASSEADLERLAQARKALSEAIWDRDEEAARAALGEAGNLDDESDLSRTFLSSATQRGWREGMRMLVDAGAKVDARCPREFCALDWAAVERNEQGAAWLLELGADPLAKDKDGATTLMVCASHGSTEILKLLLAAGADVDAQNHEGESALILAASNEKEEELALLIEAGAKLDLQNHEGHTALWEAANDGAQEVARLLIESGADMELADGCGQTPASAARANGFENVAGMIEAAIEAKALAASVKAGQSAARIRI